MRTPGTPRRHASVEQALGHRALFEPQEIFKFKPLTHEQWIRDAARRGLKLKAEERAYLDFCQLSAIDKARAYDAGDPLAGYDFGATYDGCDWDFEPWHLIYKRGIEEVGSI